MGFFNDIMDVQQYMLTWNHFQSMLSDGFQSLLQEQDLVDVTLAVDGKFFKAHKVVLSVCSPYFRELFQQSPCKHPVIFLHDVHHSIFESLLLFMYQGEVQLKENQISAFIKLGKALRVKGLEKDVPIDNAQEMSDNEEKNMNGTFSRTSGLEELATDHLSYTCIPINQPKRCKQEPVDVDDVQDEVMCDMTTSITYKNSVQDSLGRMRTEGAEDGGSKTDSGESSTDRVVILKSRRGLPVIIHNGHIYTKHKVEHGRTVWVCVKQRPLQCGGCLTTTSGSSEPLVRSFSGHNHRQLHDIIKRLQTGGGSGSSNCGGSSSNSSPSHSHDRHDLPIEPTDLSLPVAHASHNLSLYQHP